MSRLRILCLAVIISALFVGVGARLVILQVVEHDNLTARAHRQQEREIHIDAPRGRILDRHGAVLAESGEATSVYADPHEVGDKAVTARRLASLLGKPASEILANLGRRGNYVWLARRLPAEGYDMVEALHLPGISCMREPGRDYPLGDLFQSVVGLVGVDGQPLEGLEITYDDLLRGEPGRYLRRQDGGHRPVEIRLLQAARPGNDLHLTVDEVVQHIAFTALAEGVAHNAARGGVALVLDPRNGEILAMVDAGTPGMAVSDVGRNYRSDVVSWGYEPGSIFKSVVASALLEAGQVSPDTRVYGEGGSYRVANRIFHDASGDHFGWLTCTEVLQHSSNIGMIKLTANFDPASLYDRLHAFGIGQRTHIDYPGESPGSLRTVRQWSHVSRASISIGQELEVTALQVAAFYGALANGGTWYAPHLARHNAGTPAQVERLRGRKILSRKTTRTLIDILEGVVGENGTAPKAAVEGFSVAGKTGTAQQYDPQLHHYSHTRFVSSFVGIVPAEQPRLVCIVSLDGARGKAYGGQVAAPIFKEIATRTLRYLGVQPGNPPRILQVAEAQPAPRLAALAP